MHHPRGGDSLRLFGEFTAANGDMIYTVVTEFWQEEDVLYCKYTILSEQCTGRVKGVEGYIVMHGLIDYVNMIFDIEGEGKIKF